MALSMPPRIAGGTWLRRYINPAPPPRSLLPPSACRKSITAATTQTGMQTLKIPARRLRRRAPTIAPARKETAVLHHKKRGHQGPRLALSVPGDVRTASARAGTSGKACNDVATS
jgi:hypothetical protein